MKIHLEQILRRTCGALGIDPLPLIEIEVPRDKTHGDLSTPVAMGLARQLRKSPKKIAEEIIAAITDRDPFERIEIAGPGFINFTFRPGYLHDLLKHLIAGGKSALRRDIGGSRRVLVEFVSANPTGPLHIGHARGAAVGNALCNLLAECGYRVEREYYLNDAGRQIKLLGRSVFARYQQLLGNEVPFPEEGYRGQYIDEEAAALRNESGDVYRGKTFDECGDAITGWSLARMIDLIKSDLARFGIRDFTTWVSERDIHEKGEVIAAIQALEDKGYIHEKDSALWFRSSDFGDDKDRVVRKSDGEYTYFASDISYHKHKLDRGYDIIIDIWGADHHGYVPRIASVMKAFGYDTSCFRVVLVQMVNLLRHGKPFQMSKRAGTFVTLSEIIDLVGPDITKFIFLTRKADSHLDFDVDVVTASSAENPVFYVQYAGARISSIFKNAEDSGIDLSMLQRADLGLLQLPVERELIKKLLVYPMVLESAALAFEPHRITFYLQELAGIFHSFYHDHRVLTDDSELTLARLFLCSAVKTVLRDALGILDVTTPEKM